MSDLTENTTPEETPQEPTPPVDSQDIAPEPVEFEASTPETGEVESAALEQVESEPPAPEMIEPELPAPVQVEASPAETPAKASKGYLRFEMVSRIEHWVFMLSFTTLAITGLVQKFAQNPISQGIVQLLGGIENTRTIHHVAATLTLLSVVYHIGALGYKMYVRRDRPTMLPGLFDVKNAWQSLRYNFGFSKARPQQGRYGYEEKMEYWAVVWGTIVMAITGFMMWNPIATTRFLPGEAVPAAKAAHGWEAVLAVSAIILWHFYNVLVRTFNKSMFNGRLNDHQMVDEHPLELADIKAGLAETPTSHESRRRRLRIFIPTYAVIAIALLVGIYFFVAYEQTAIAYEPQPEQAEIFVPLTPTPLPTPVPTSTPIPGGLTSWEGGIQDLFQTRCVICHNPAGKIGGLDLSTYQSAVAGGNLGPGIIPGDPENSQIVIMQSAGGHPGQLSPDELAQIKDWIANGAPER
jgi:cytochrome b subunit of formate dehydrogenase